MFTRVFIIWILFALNGAAIYAADDECGYVRLDEPGKSMEKIPGLDQGEKGYCASFPGAAMVDAWRFSHGDTDSRHLTSPTASHLIYSSRKSNAERKSGDERGRVRTDGGDIGEVVESIRENGSCSREFFRKREGSAGFSLAKRLQKSYLEYEKIRIAEQQKESGKWFYQRWLASDSEAYLTQARERLAREAYTCIQREVEYMPGFQVPGVEVLQKALELPNHLHFLSALVKHACGGPNTRKVDVPKPKKEDFSWHENKKLESKLHSLLSKGNVQPIGLNICGEVIRKGMDYRGHIIPREGRHCSDESEHAVLVIGRRKSPKTGKCQFLLRNSWAGTCRDGRVWAWECDTEKGKSKATEFNLWIDTEKLSSQSFGVVWLE